VRFSFTQESLAIRDAVRALLARECTPPRVREAWSNESGHIPELWGRLAALGVPGMLAPEADGGLGLTEIELVLVLEESGRFAAPEPILDTAALAVPLLRDAESPALRAVAAGESVVVVGLGGSPFVAGADTADALVLEHAGDLHFVDRASVTLAPAESIDGSRRLAEIRWTPTPETHLVAPPGVASLFASTRDRAAVGLAAQLIGLARGMLDRTVDYVKARHQFGRPVGSFQAVKHHLADALVAIELAAPTVYRAAWSLAHAAPDRSLHASMAKACASEAATLVARQALQCHGAIGYAFEGDLHMWMKRAWALAAAGGDAAFHRARIGRAIFETEGV
jgi:alkylation response protein AidB-like acyl-CoA dehydrogenase